MRLPPHLGLVDVIDAAEESFSKFGQEVRVGILSIELEWTALHKVVVLPTGRFADGFSAGCRKRGLEYVDIDLERDILVIVVVAVDVGRLGFAGLGLLSTAAGRFMLVLPALLALLLLFFFAELIGDNCGISN